MGEQFPAIPFNYLKGQMCSVRHHIILKDDSFLLWMFFTKCVTKFVEHLNIASCIDHFSFFQKVNQYASFAVLKDSSHNFAGWGYCFCLLAFGGCGVLPFCALLFGLQKYLIDDSCQVSFFTGNSVTACWWNDMSVTAIFSQCMAGK